MMEPVDLSAHKAIVFAAKGDGQTYRIMLFAQSHGFIPAIQTFVAGAEWKTYRFSFSSFAGVDPHGLMGVVFAAGPEAGNFSFQIDDVKFE